MTELPTTAIGLIAFILAGAGGLLWRLSVVKANESLKTVETFMTYIEKKNGNLERATKLFTETMEEQGTRHKDAMVNQNERHQQMMDDIAARLEQIVSSGVTKRKRRSK